MDLVPLIAVAGLAAAAAAALALVAILGRPAPPPPAADSGFAVSTEGMKVCPACGMGNLWTERRCSACGGELRG